MFLPKMSQDQTAASRASSATRKLSRLRYWLRCPALLFIVAAVLRISVVAVFLAHNSLSWGVNEAAGIGRQLALGHGFASPFHDAFGPTAWLAPVYPSLLASLFLLFGIQTTAAACATVFLNAIFGSLTVLVILKLGQQHFGETPAIIAAWAWAVSPPAVVWAWYLWETSMSALVLSFALLQTLRLGSDSGFRQWAICGLIWSFAALLNPVLLAPLPFLVLARAWKGRCWKHVATMVLACAVGIAPWTIRNLIRQHHLIPVRSNFWPEVFFGNVTFELHPTGPSMVYQREGEIAFAADMRSRVIEYIRSNRGEFARRTGQRVLEFWTGPIYFKPLPAVLILAAIAGIFCARAVGREWLSFASVLLFYPPIYYLSYTFARYRHPIEPVMYTLAALTVSELTAGAARLLMACSRGEK